MLARLRIRDLALVDQLELDLGPGLNVLTGETGAGKSVLVGALSLVLGGRAAPELVRVGAEEAVVEAELALSDDHPLRARLIASGVEGGGHLVLRRSVPRVGRSRAWLAGRSVSVGLLADLMRGLVDLTSQHEHVALLDPEVHLDLVDAFGGLTGLRADVERAHAEAARHRLERDDLAGRAAERERRADYLAFAVQEIDSVAPEVGEVERLQQERARLRGAGELARGLAEAEGQLYSCEGAAVDVLARVARTLGRLAALDAALEPQVRAAERLLAEAEELGRGLGRRLDAVDARPERLEEIEDRLDALERLVRKHGRSVVEVLERRAAMGRELEGIERSGARLEDVEGALSAAEERLRVAAATLGAARRGAAAALADRVSESLRELCMGDSRLEVALTPLSEVGPRGGERAELMLVSGRGETARALRRTASGGELSRVLLALKQVLAGRSARATYVFDEVDTGLGGAVAEVIGAKLAAVARTAQVIVVTHLPQVAAHAEHHFRVAKRERGGRTVTEVCRLDAGAAVHEIARMLGGTQVTPKTLALAEELRSRNHASGADAASGEELGRPRRASVRRLPASRPSPRARAAGAGG